MLKKILKNKFFILFTSFIIIVITARFSPIFTLTERIIALSLGIEENDTGYTVIIEAIKPSNNIGEVERFEGSGKSIELAISEIENNNNKRVSLAQTEVVFIDSNLLKSTNLQFLGVDRLKAVPEVAVNVVTNSPKAIIYGKLSENMHSSHEIGGFIRKNKQKLGVLEVNFKDFGRDYMSFLGCVTMPFIEYYDKTNPNDEGTNEDSAIATTTNGKDITVYCNKGIAYSKNNSFILDYNNYISYLILKDNLTNNTGNIKLNLDKSIGNIYCNNIKVKKQNSIKNNVYITEYEVYIDYFDNETYFVLDNDKFSKVKIDQSNIDIFTDYIKNMLLQFLQLTKNQSVDILHLYDEFYTIDENISKDFLDNFNYIVSVKLNKSKVKH